MRAVSRLQLAVQALASPHDIQTQLFPDFACKCEELAFEWDEHFSAASTDGWTPAQLASTAGLEAKLVAMSRGGLEYSEALWADESSLRDAQPWTEVRGLAREVLTAFGWPHEPPPRDPADRGYVYVR
ncbi:MAG: hypothetical protein AB8H80_22900 [Planctomycetota bacterium]